MTTDDRWPGYVRAGRQLHDAPCPDHVRDAIDQITTLIAKEQAMTDISGLVGTDSTDDLPEDETFDPVPEGEYNLRVDDVDVKENNDGNGHYLRVETEVLGPEYDGRKVFENITIDHDNAPDAEEIGRRQLRNLAEATNTDDVLTNVESLIGGQFTARVTIDSWTGDDGEQRESNGLRNFQEVVDIPEGPDDVEPGRPSSESSGPTTSKSDLDDAAPF